MNDAPEYGETWVYESIVGALPGVNIGEAGAIALQIAVFEIAVLVFAWVYGLWTAAVAGTAAIVVAAAGSVVMLRMGEWTRAARVPAPYRRLLFGSSIEVVLGVLAFVALVTHLFAFDPQQPGTPLMTTLFGPEPPVVVVYLTLLVLWDLCYRIGTSWWAAVVGLWGAVRYRFDGPTAGTVRPRFRVIAGRRDHAGKYLSASTPLSSFPFLTLHDPCTRRENDFIARGATI